jgi:hypothetical protein
MMKQMVKLLVVLALSLSAFTVAQARDTQLFLPVKAAIEAGKAQGKLGDDVQFYFGDVKPKNGYTTLAGGLTTNKKTNGANKSDEAACQIALLSALIQFQNRARSEGGNAVVNLVSYYKKNTYKSNTDYECHAGNFVVGVALKGDVVRLK